jgi:hypothetical protein
MMLQRQVQRHSEANDRGASAIRAAADRRRSMLMSTIQCPACGSCEWVPVVRLFLDVGLDRPPCPLSLEQEPEAVWYQCVNGCVGVTGQGEIIGLGVRRHPEKATVPGNGSPGA